MTSIIAKIPSKSLIRFLTATRSLSTATESRTLKLERIANELLDLTKLERYGFAILFLRKMLYGSVGGAAVTKIKLIKEVRGFTDLGLKEAKEFVEKATMILKKGLSNDEANAIVAKFKELGATAIVE